MKTYAIFGPGHIRDNQEAKRPYANRTNVYRCLDGLPDIKFLLLDGGVGVGRISEDYARERGIPYEVIRPSSPEITTMGIRAAFSLRDTIMLDRCDALVVFANPGLSGQTRLISDGVLTRKPVMVFSV